MTTLDVTWCQNAASHCDSARYPQALERLAFQYKHQAGCELRDDCQWDFVVVHIYLHSRGMSAATSPTATAAQNKNSMKFRAPPTAAPPEPAEATSGFSSNRKTIDIPPVRRYCSGQKKGGLGPIHVQIDPSLVV
jgi:hypothetical protein